MYAFGVFIQNNHTLHARHTFYRFMNSLGIKPMTLHWNSTLFY